MTQKSDQRLPEWLTFDLLVILYRSRLSAWPSGLLSNSRSRIPHVGLRHPHIHAAFSG
jgi:hypothetical protein